MAVCGKYPCAQKTVARYLEPQTRLVVVDWNALAFHQRQLNRRISDESTREMTNNRALPAGRNMRLLSPTAQPHAGDPVAKLRVSSARHHPRLGDKKKKDTGRVYKSLNRRMVKD